MNDLLSEQTLSSVSKRLGYHTYKYPRPGVCSDIIVVFYPVSVKHKPPQVLLIKRGGEPFKDMWALPGGFVNAGETFKEAAKRELKEETGLDAENKLGFVQIADKPDRDPRGWTISSVFECVFCAWDRPEVKAADDAIDYKWFNVNDLPELAFDHKDILDRYLHYKGYYFENH